MLKELIELKEFLVVLALSLISGFVSIARKIDKGHPISALWVVSEFFMAILCGYLMYTAYPHINYIPEWFTMPVAIALAAHIGGRCIQELQEVFLEKYGKVLGLIGRRKDD